MVATPSTDELNQKVLSHLSREELIQQIEILQEELQLSKALPQIGEQGPSDATLHWRGRSRFLAEKVMPVRLTPVMKESLAPENGTNFIINGDNLEVWPESHWPGFALRKADVFQCDMAW